MRVRAWWCLVFPACAVLAQSPDAGRRQFENRCAICHGGDGNGGEHAPGMVPRLAGRSDEELAAFIRTGLPSRGMPASDVPAGEMQELVAHLRTLRPPQRGGMTPVPGKVPTIDGQILEGLILNKGPEEVQLRTPDKRIHLLRKASGDRYRPVTSQADWPTYHGQVSGNRYSGLTQINKNNVSRLGAKWIFAFSDTARLQTTPLVVDGIMYVTSGNECIALDAGSGRQLWQFQRPRTPGLIGNAAGGFNRGVAVAGERLFMVTDNAHLLALNRFTGERAWETEMADWRQNYNATGAPLIVGNLVISGTAGGEQGVRGLLAAYDQETGKEVWRFWTVPLPGEPKSETWAGVGIAHGGAPTWYTGTYDPESGTIYWPTGNASPDLNGDLRPGDNLYACSILALDAKTGKLKWYYQFTPHDEWDWDATEPPVLVDMAWQGQPRKLLVQANRNGFLYVLDRTTGKLLQATPLVKKLTWAKAIGADGRPVLNPNQTPTPQGVKICPSMSGATNWYSTSFNPGTGLYYVQTLEDCAIYTKRPVEWGALRGFMGGSTRPGPDEPPGQKILRAFDLRTGQAVWELPQTGPANTWGGALSTAGGVVFFGDDNGSFSAADAATGKPLWSFMNNQSWHASPMTYQFDGKQYVAVAAGPNIVAFALPE